MQFTISAAALLAFASTALAQVPGFDTITKPQTGEVLAAGETYTVVWDPSPAKYDDETISIFLLSGPTQQTLIPSEEPIATGIVNKAGTWDWAVPLSLGDQEIYGLIIRLESDPEMFQYSFPFHIDGDEAVPSNSTEPTASATDDSSSTVVSSASVEPTASSSATITTAEPPKTTVLTTTSSSSDASVSASASASSSSDDAAPEPTEEVSGAASNGVMGTFAIIGAAAAAMFAF